MVAAVVGLLKFGLALGLLIAWGFVIVPPVIRLLGGVGRGRGADSVGSFRDKMSLLGNGSTPSHTSQRFDMTNRPANLGAGTARRQRQAAKQRRRTILGGLLGAAGVTLLAALVIGGLAWALFAIVLVALVGYVALLWQMQQVALDRRGKVAYLPQQQYAHTDEAAGLRHVGTARG